MEIPEPLRGDVVLRKGEPQLAEIIEFPYTHAGIALNGHTIHQVADRWYESISLQRFFRKSGGGAILRFTGYAAPTIRNLAAEIAQYRRYPKQDFNLLSASANRHTVNCTEFVLSLFELALEKIMRELRHCGSWELLEAYERAYLSEPLKYSSDWNYHSDYRLALPQMLKRDAFGSTIKWTVKRAERQSNLRHEHIQHDFEGPYYCVHGSEYFCLRSEAILWAFTPKSVFESKRFKVVEEF